MCDARLRIALPGEKDHVDLGGTLENEKPIPVRSFFDVMRIYDALQWLTGSRLQDQELIITEVDKDGLLYKCGITDGDILESANHGLVGGLGIKKLLDAIRERTVLVLGLKRRTSAYFYTPFVVILEITVTGSGPHWNFSGFHYWNKTVANIPYTPLDIKPLTTYKYFSEFDVYLRLTVNQDDYWLAADKTQEKLFFQKNERGTQSKFLMLQYIPTSRVILGETIVVLFPNDDGGRMCNLAIAVTDDGSVLLSANSLHEMKGEITDSVFVFYITKTSADLFNIRSRDEQHLLAIQPELDPPIPTLRRLSSTPANYQDFWIEDEDGSMIVIGN